MRNVAHAKKPSALPATYCPCGWGKHCRCFDGESRFRTWGLVELMRGILDGGTDLTRRRLTLEAMRNVVAAHDQRSADTKALHALYDVLPRFKDIGLVQRISCDDHRNPQTDEEIAERWNTPVEHVRLLRALILDAYEGRPIRLPRDWRQLAKQRIAKERAIKAARSARRSARQARRAA